MRNDTKSKNLLTIAANQKIKERDYWLKKLSGDLVKSSFIYDYDKADTICKESEAGADEIGYPAVAFRFSDKVFRKLIKLSNKSDTRLHMILLAGVVVLLKKYTGSNDIIVGAPVQKQEQEAQFLNTVLILRNQVNGSVSFKELLFQVKQAVVEAVEHQNYPIELLPEQLNISASSSAKANESPFFNRESVRC